MTSLAEIWSAGQAAAPALIDTKVAEIEALAAAGKLSGKAAERIVTRLTAPQPAPAAANDNVPSNTEHRARLEKIQADHGGTIRASGNSWTLFGAEVDGVAGLAFIDANGRAILQSTKGVFPIDESPAKELALLNPVDWHGQPVPKRDWYIDNLIPARQVTILSGDGGVGKSLLALQIGAAGAMSIETVGFTPVAGRCLYLGAEDESDEFHRRLADIVQEHGRTLSDLGDFRLVPMAGEDALLSIPDKSGVMQPTPFWKQFAAAARQFQPRLIILDTVADLFGGDEIKRGQARQFIGMLRKLAIEIDCAVVLLAHPSQQGMTSGTGKSGSTGWSNSCRSMLYMTRPDGKEDDADARLLSTKKINYGPIGGELKLRWQDGAFVLDDGKPAAASALLNARHDRIFVELLSNINRAGQRLATTKGINYAPSIMAEHPSAVGVSKKQLESSMRRLLADRTIKLVFEGPPSKQRQRLIVSAEDFGPDAD